MHCWTTDRFAMDSLTVHSMSSLRSVALWAAVTRKATSLAVALLVVSMATSMGALPQEQLVARRTGTLVLQGALSMLCRLKESSWRLDPMPVRMIRN